MKKLAEAAEELDAARRVSARPSVQISSADLVGVGRMLRLGSYALRVTSEQARTAVPSLAVGLESSAAALGAAIPGQVRAEHPDWFAEDTVLSNAWRATLEKWRR